MLFASVTAATLVLAPTSDLPQTPHFPHYAMAAALLGAKGEPRYAPPTEVEIKSGSNEPLTPEALPAPAPPPNLDGSRHAALAPSQPLEPEPLPAPVVLQQTAQVTPTNEELLRRLEKVEEENRRLRESQPSPSPLAPPTAATATPQDLPKQMIPGWRVSLHDWNSDGTTNTYPQKVFNMRNGRVSATLGQSRSVPFDSTTQIRRSRDNHTNQMFIYKLDGWLNVTRPGTYQLGYEMNCPTFHGCSLLVKIGDQQIINERDKNFENKVLYESRQLTPGAYRMQVVFNIAKNKFIKFQPGTVTLYPLIRGPNENNFRNFNPDELVTEASPSVPTGMPRY